jgi:hypothetical protein
VFGTAVSPLGNGLFQAETITVNNLTIHSLWTLLWKNLTLF